ncbi:MAG: M23 family metallopeptidase [Flavobacteriaceae bacterium]|jgi:murein DD-endopeptidase MepM/ murein hydrolase activator NlpD|nr:M23 family metallopeptidase [Flavobacteriaceae bacterium]MDG2500267.1 M23 family metallopeptidase [Flavobacteriaceae bacterium]
MPKKKKHTLLDKLSERFHILLVNEKTLAKKKLFSTSTINLVGSSLFAFLLLLSTSFIVIYFTPLKEYFRGYTSIELRENAVENSMKLDSLENLYLAQSNYIKSLKNILSGNISFDDINDDTGAFETNQVELELIKTNKEDSLLRALVDEEDKYNAFELEGDRFTTVLFPPVKGDLSSEFDYENKHYGVDIAMPENSPVHSISEGIVVFAEWTSETGFVIIAEHLNGLTSIYKHNSSIVKAQGDIIQTGEIIAFTGNTGSLTTGPHLHFELWYQGEPVDPENYIEF